MLLQTPLLEHQMPQQKKKRIDISLIKESELIPPYSSLKKQTEKIGKITLLQREIKNGR